MRLDAALVERGHYATRSRAADAVRRGCVRVDGTPAVKAGAKLRDEASIEIADAAAAYVSRAALKLVAGLDGITVEGRRALDIGASTGGFTQVLLERGAAEVVALDVGHGQLDETLRADGRVTVLEGLNARDLAAGHLPFTPDLLVCDVSFVSLKLALPPALELAASGAEAVFLVKPQFEVGRGGIGKGGIVATEDGERVAADLRDWLDGQEGWQATRLVPCPLPGADGNREWLLVGRKGAA